MDIRILRGHEVSEANQLIKDVFMRQIAPTYVEEGIQTFLSSFNDEQIGRASCRERVLTSV